MHPVGAPFWFRPNSSFGRAVLTRIRAVVQLTYPYGTSLAPQPPCCWQSRPGPFAGARPRSSGGTLFRELHTPPLPTVHVSVGYSRSYVRSRTTLSRRLGDKASQSLRPGRSIWPVSRCVGGPNGATEKFPGIERSEESRKSRPSLVAEKQHRRGILTVRHQPKLRLSVSALAHALPKGT